MKPEIKKRFVEALRSGKYSRTVGRCKRNDCYCVTGILYLLAEEDGIGKYCNDDLFLTNDGIESNTDLNPSIIQWLGLEKPKMTYVSLKVRTKDEQEFKLWELNDKGWSFERLADLIEESEVYV